MSYCDLIRQEGEYTYSANIQFDIENDTKLLRFIPNDTTIKLLKEYFTDLVRAKSYNHSRILYGSYGTGKSHFLTVLSQLVEKKFVDGMAYQTFIERVRCLDSSLANDIDAFIVDHMQYRRMMAQCSLIQKKLSIKLTNEIGQMSHGMI